MKTNFDIEQDSMRKEMKMIRTLYGLKNKDIANELGINISSFTQWISGYLDFGAEKKQIVQEYLDEKSNDELRYMVLS